MARVIKSNAIFLISNEEIENVYTSVYNFLDKGGYVGKATLNSIAEDTSICDAIEGLFRLFRWQVCYDPYYNIVDMKIIGDSITGLTLYLFKAIAPYVVNESYIDIEQTDGLVLRYNFVGKKVKRKYFAANDPDYIAGRPVADANFQRAGIELPHFELRGFEQAMEPEMFRFQFQDQEIGRAHV